MTVRICLCVSISIPVPVPVPRDSLVRHNLAQSTTHRSHQVQQSRAKFAMHFILTFKVNAIGTARTSVLLESPYLFVFVCPLAFQFQSQSHVTRPHATTQHNPSRIEVIKYSKAGPKLQCSSSWLSKSMQLELPKPMYCSDHSSYSSLCVHWRSSSSPSPTWLAPTPQPTIKKEVNFHKRSPMAYLEEKL
jgi:hypothetical protein